MPFIPIPNGIAMQLVYTDPTEAVTFSNVLHGGVPGGFVLTQVSTDNIANAIGIGVDGSGIADRWSTDVTLDHVVVTDLRALGAPQFIGGLGRAGTNGADALPDELAVVVSLRSTFRDKTGRGRVYLAGFTEADNAANGRISATLVSAAHDMIDGISGEIAGVGVSLAVRSLHPVPQMRDVISIEVRNSIWKTQRRRRPAA